MSQLPNTPAPNQTKNLGYHEPDPKTTAPKDGTEYGVLAIMKEDTARAAKALAEETEADKRLDFHTAAEMLNEVGINLGNELEKSYDRDRRYNLLELGEEFNSPDPEALIEREDLTESMKYHQHFQGVTFDKADIAEVIEMVKQCKKIMTICARGGLLPAPLFNKLFIESGIPYYNDTHALNKLENLREIAPKDLKDLAILHLWTTQTQTNTFVEAWQKSSPLEPSAPSIHFTINELEPSQTSKSATQCLQDLKKGKQKFLSPNENFLRWITQMDESLKKILGEEKFRDLSVGEYREKVKSFLGDRKNNHMIPDASSYTMYPNYVYKNGLVPHFSFRVANSHAVNRKIDLTNYFPDLASKWLGVRRSLG